MFVTVMDSKPRLIDRWPAQARTKPMRVIVLSPARSGTTSVEYALKQLGYNVYCGMKHAFIHAKTENCYPHWSEAIDAKYNNSGAKPYDTADFEKILGQYDAVVGWPASCFVDEMLAAYPDAKIILMQRDVDAWIKSMQKSLCTRLSWPSWKVILPIENGVVKDCIRCGQRCMSLWTDGDFWDANALRQHFIEHNNYVRKVVPQDRLLEYDVRQGWQPLCNFLEESIPDTPFPREAVAGNFEKQGKFIWMLGLVKATAKVLSTGTVLGLVAAGVVMYRRRR